MENVILKYIKTKCQHCRCLVVNLALEQVDEIYHGENK